MIDQLISMDYVNIPVWDQTVNKWERGKEIGFGIWKLFGSQFFSSDGLPVGEGANMFL